MANRLCTFGAIITASGVGRDWRAGIRRNGGKLDATDQELALAFTAYSDDLVGSLLPDAAGPVVVADGIGDDG